MGRHPLMGRPPKAAADKQDQLIMLRLTRREKTVIFHAARAACKPAATFVRQVALERAREIADWLDDKTSDNR